MPADFLLPLFVVTLIANAVLVVVAIRSMRRVRPEFEGTSGFTRPSANRTSAGPAGKARADGQLHGPDHSTIDQLARPLADELARAVARRRSVLDEVAAPSDGPPIPVQPDDGPGATPTEPASAAPGASGADEPGADEPGSDVSNAGAAAAAGSTPARRRPASRKTTKASASGRAGSPRAPAAGARSRGRRRFALPPLDDDHERVNRSLETFLGGVGPSSDNPAGGATRAASSDATTVAIVAVDGFAGRNAANVVDALAMVERTLRGAARGSDVVTAAGRDRFRIVLPATGQLAARAYLRRTRATIEPILEAAAPPLRLAVATATVLDEPIDEAVRRAERRLAVVLDAARAAHKAGVGTRPAGGDDDGDEAEPEREPRVAGD